MKQFTSFLSHHEGNTTAFKDMLLMLVVMFLASCSSDDFPNGQHSSEKMSLTLSVSPTEWGSQATTRATYSTFSESSGNKNLPTTFQSGDAIGLFACDKTGKVVIANKKYTYNGSAWNTEEPVEYVTGLGSYSFFGYYPWQETLTGAPAINATPDITSADTFFATAIASWTPAADQGDVTKFTSQDLMAAKGTNSMPYFHEVQVTFSLAHKMGLLVTKSSLDYYDIDNPSDTWTVNQTFTTNIPYAIGSNYYFFAKPGVATTLGTKTTTVQSGQVEQLFFTNGEPSHR